MILKNNLYTIDNREDISGKTVFRLKLNPECFIYKAHFPGMPITPGVCLVQTASELLSEFAGKKLKLRRIKNAKFLAVVSPESSPEISFTLNKLTVNEATGETAAQFTVESATDPKAKLSIICTQE